MSPRLRQPVLSVPHPAGDVYSKRVQALQELNSEDRAGADPAGCCCQLLRKVGMGGRLGWVSPQSPGLFIFLTIMSFNFLGDYLRDRFDPRAAGL